MTERTHEVRGGTARELRHDIERVLRRRRARPGTTTATLESRLKSTGARGWHFLRRHPAMGVALVGGGAFAAAASVGVGELAFAVGAAFAAYKVLRKGEAPDRAIEDVIGSAR